MCTIFAADPLIPRQTENRGVYRIIHEKSKPCTKMTAYANVQIKRSAVRAAFRWFMYFCFTHISNRICTYCLHVS